MGNTRTALSIAPHMATQTAAPAANTRTALSIAQPTAIPIAAPVDKAVKVRPTARATVIQIVVPAENIQMARPIALNMDNDTIHALIAIKPPQGMNPNAFAEVNKILRKRKPTVADQMKITIAYDCLNALLGPKRVRHLCNLVDKEKP